MFKKYEFENNEDKKVKNYCSFIAISVAEGISFQKAMNLRLKRDGRKCREVSRLANGIKELGYTLTIPAKKDTKAYKNYFKKFQHVECHYGDAEKRMTVKKFAETHPTGKYILIVSHHAIAVVDGQYVDTTDTGRCQVQLVFKKVLDK